MPSTDPNLPIDPIGKGESDSNSGPRFLIRFFRPEDRVHIRRICADTGFLGTPIDPLFEDRELFADYLTGYYTDREPESTLVCEVDGQVMGYITGSRHPRRYARYRLWNNPPLFIRGMWRYFFRPYGAASRRYITWLLRRAGAESPHAPEGMPHFHINLLPPARKVSETRALIDRFLAYLAENGDKKVYGQMVTFDGRRGVRMFERYGFKVLDQVEVTKYRHLRDEAVFLFTVVKDLEANTHLYGSRPSSSLKQDQNKNQDDPETSPQS